MVLVKENLPRGSWKIAKIKELNRSADGNYRSAKLSLPNKKTFVRPIALLYPLECPGTKQDGNEIETEEGTQGNSEYQGKDETKPGARPKRKAALEARDQLAKWTRQLQ